MKLYKSAKDLTGRTNGWLSVIESTGESNRHGVLWRVRCRCGTERIMPAAQFLKPTKKEGSMRSCGCGSRQSRVYTSKFASAGELTGHRFGLLKASAKKREHVFEVTAEYLWGVFIDQQRKCALTGAALMMSRKHAHDGEALASLDRIDSTRGYVLGNVQWVHPTINFMKHAMPQDTFIEWCRLVAAHKAP